LKEKISISALIGSGLVEELFAAQKMKIFTIMLSECTLRNITINQALWETILKIVKELKSVNLTYYQKYKGQFQLFFCGFSDKLFFCPKKTSTKEVEVQNN
jgi:hypothetical protein